MSCRAILVAVAVFAATAASADEPKPVTLEAEARIAGTKDFRFSTVTVRLVATQECAVITKGLSSSVTRDGKKATLTVTLPERKDVKGRAVVPSTSDLGIVQLQAGEVAVASVPSSDLQQLARDALAGKLELTVVYDMPEAHVKRFKVGGGKVAGTVTAAAE